MYLTDEAVLDNWRLLHVDAAMRTVAPKKAALWRQRMATRLRAERELCETLLGSVRVQLIDVDAAASTAVGRGWVLQSHANCDQRSVAGLTVAAARQVLSASDWVILAAPGVDLHPSAAYLVASAGADTDAMSWPVYVNETSAAPGLSLPQAPDGLSEDETLIRLRRFDRYTAWHVRDQSLVYAVRSNSLAECPNAAIKALVEGDLHPILIWLSTRIEKRWEVFAGCMAQCSAPALARYRNAPPRPLMFYRRLLETGAPEMTLGPPPPGSQSPFLARPRADAQRISVIVCFRDKPELTKTFLKSLAEQTAVTAGKVELILVNNRSTHAAVDSVKAQLTTLNAAWTTQWIDFDEPFNHSRQNNLAVRQSTGDVVVLANNDLELISRNALEDMAAWALIPGIGTVGCTLINDDPARNCYGHVERNSPFLCADKIVDEAHDPYLHEVLRVVPGNTYAIASVARGLYERNGGLNELRIPVAYNDVDLNMRMTTLKYLHINLGYLVARHENSSSRAKQDNLIQLVESQAKVNNLKWTDETNNWRTL